MTTSTNTTVGRGREGHKEQLVNVVEYYLPYLIEVLSTRVENENVSPFPLCTTAYCATLSFFFGIITSK